jgi:hypothetical protein
VGRVVPVVTPRKPATKEGEKLIFHVCVNVTDALHYDDDMLTDLFKNTNVSEVRARLAILKAQGHTFCPICLHCDNFLPKKGCLGHRAGERASTI